ncbi:MAG: S8 family serine peptidase [Thermodesulfovibrionia bacterium]|nr:S8 family serine peptidase [Thermodesulfovibrionia bacterium]
MKRTALLILILLSIFILLPSSASAVWTIQTVDSVGDVGYYTSIAIDSLDKMHISYNDVTNLDLKYTTNASGSWVTTTVDSSGTVGYYTSIAIDSSGKVHISYYDVTNLDLKYATNASGSWVTTTVDSTGYVGSYTSIAIDSSGKIHISYFDITNSNLKYATNASGSWVTTTVDSSGYVGAYTSIAIDSSDKMHISYYDVTNSDLKYATNASGSWVTTTVDSTGYVRSYTSIAIDSSDKMHISYYDGTNLDLKYATNASGSWVTTAVDSTGYVGSYSSIAIDSSGKMHISYDDGSNGDLKYATNASGSWVTTTVDSTVAVGMYTSIAIDSSDKMHISYYDATNTNLRYTNSLTEVGIVPPVLRIEPSTMPIVILEQNRTADELLTMFNDGGSNLAFDLAINFSGSTLPWLSFDISSGVIPAGSSQQVIMTYDAANMNSGDYSADISVTSNDPAIPLITVSASMTVIPDITPPDPVNDLSASNATFESMLLNWTAVADNGSTGVAAGSYDIRYSTETITEANWGTAIQTDGEPAPGGPGSPESFLITGLSASTTYYFAVKVTDDLGLISAVSNIASSATVAAPILQISPSSVSDTLVEGGISSHTLTLSNTGGDTLTYSVSLSETLTPAGIMSTSTYRTEKVSFIQNIPEGVDYVPGEIIVRFKSESKLNKSKSLHRKNAGAKLKHKFEKLDMEVWEMPKKSLNAHINDIATLSADPDVLYAEPNYIYTISSTPNDPSYSQLWGLNNTGQTGGQADADIDAPEAWDMFTGSSDVVVAVIDTGIDYNHQDLAANMWTNVNETAGNGIDDDANGYIDDIYGYDFAYGDSNPMDGNHHGTHCAGTIGAVGSNGTGVVGVNQSVKLMAVKFLDDSGSGSTTDAISSILYAVNNGADILSNSWGGGGYSTALEDAIRYANDNNVLFVAAAGNDGLNTDTSPNYPSNYDLPNILSIAATDHNDLIASFSNYGAATVDLGAPGVSILSTYPNNSYNTISGTSMATPHVSGVAALLKGFNPSLSALQIKSIIMDSADPVSSLSGITVTGGRLNALKALQLAGYDWIRLSGNITGTIEPGFSIDLSIDLNSTAKASGGYGAEITITSNDPVNPVQVMPVSLTVMPDCCPPDDIASLIVTSFGSTSASLQWTAVGDDGSAGRASSYDIRYSTALLDAASWDTAAQAAGEPSPSDPGSTETFTINTLLPQTHYWIGIKVLDNSSQTSGISNTVEVTTPIPPILRADPAVMPLVSMMPGLETTRVLRLHNDGGEDLTFNLSIQNVIGINAGSNAVPAVSSYIEINKTEDSTLPVPPVTQGFGGPDSYGYQWSDSDEAGGPVFDWIDISATGTEISGLSDDSYAGPFPVGFNFDYYGNNQAQFYVQSNGLISFDAHYYTLMNYSIPLADAYNNMIAWMWDDLYPYSGSSHVYYKTIDSSKLVVQFNNYGEYAGSGSVDSQVILNSNGDIKIQYKEFRSSMSLNSSTVGIENADGSDGLQVAYNTSYLHNNLAVLFSSLPEWLAPDITSGTIPPGGSADLTVTYSSVGLDIGSYTSSIVVNSNDPAAPQTSIQADLEVLNSPPTADAGGPYAAIEGNSVPLNGSASSDPNNNISTYEWDIDNNGTYDYSSASSSQSHTYAQQGTYTVKLRVTDAMAATSEATTTAVISDTSPTAEFTGNPTSGRAPLTVTFTNSSTGNDTPLTYEWDFDNNGSVDSTLLNPSYEYAGTGEYSVKLTVTDSDGSTNSLTRLNYISATSCLSPVRVIGSANSYYTSLQPAYDDSSEGDDIHFQDDTFNENLIFNTNKTITLRGGYDCDFNPTTGKTVINGNVTISDGVVTMENVIIQ